MLEQLPKEPGTYVVVLRNRNRASVAVGRLGSMATSAGYYLYVGSALGPGGLRARISHHLKVSSRPRWHIDYLRRSADLVIVWHQAGSSPQEHRWARVMNGCLGIEVAARRFGASDCRCESHLFFSESLPRLKVFRDGLLSEGLADGLREWLPPFATGVSGA